MLAERLGIRMVKKGEIIPNAEIKFPKDVEDAFFLYKLFKERIKGRVLNDHAKRLGVEVPF